MKRIRRVAWLIMVIADAGLLAWGMMAARRRNICWGQTSHQS